MIDIWYNVDESWKHYANERSHSQKTTYYMIIVIWNVQSGQIYKDRKISGYLKLGWKGRRKGDWYLISSFLVGGRNRMFWNWLWCLYNPVNILKHIELCTLREWIVWYVNLYLNKAIFKMIKANANELLSKSFFLCAWEIP